MPATEAMTTFKLDGFSQDCTELVTLEFITHSS